MACIKNAMYYIDGNTDPMELWLRDRAPIIIPLNDDNTIELS